MFLESSHILRMILSLKVISWMQTSNTSVLYEMPGQCNVSTHRFAISCEDSGKATLTTHTRDPSKGQSLCLVDERKWPCLKKAHGQ